MGLLQEWRDYAYKFDDRTQEGQQFWLSYFGIEKEIYVKLLSDKDFVEKGTVKELAEKYETELQFFVGFLDGCMNWNSGTIFCQRREEKSCIKNRNHPRQL